MDYQDEEKFLSGLDKLSWQKTNGPIKVKNEEKYPIFVSRDFLDKVRNVLPEVLFEELELNYELGFMHNVLGHKNYKEEVETIIRAKRGMSPIPAIEYNIKHK